jgi:hypothetical protein
MKTLISRIPVNKIIFWLPIVVFTGIFAFQNKKMLCVYYEYFRYKISFENSDAMSSMYGMIDYGMEAEYTCKDKQSPGAYAYKELAKRKKHSIESNQYRIGHCVHLPTGQIILTISNSTVKYYVLLESDGYNPESYRVLDIRGETLG